ncbi:PREDICTED: uncharacterized protein LOC106818342, partial [Priapulus caudatus]|uniref:Uncharacterized protein LOC106818342 n=1 Tax=Priapulus caudatus TaxID=37621 RepID=A0ABM1F272_PRICU
MDSSSRPSFLHSVLGSSKSPTAVGREPERLNDVLARYPSQQQQQQQQQDASALGRHAVNGESVVSSPLQAQKAREIDALTASESDTLAGSHAAPMHETKAERLIRMQEDRKRQLAVRAEQGSSDSDEGQTRRHSKPRRLKKEGKSGETPSTDPDSGSRRKSSREASPAKATRSAKKPAIAASSEVASAQTPKAFVEYVDTSLSTPAPPSGTEQKQVREEKKKEEKAAAERRGRKELYDAELKRLKDKSAKRKSALNSPANNT